MNISTYKEQKVKASIFGKIGIFSASLLTAASAVYIYSPVIGSHADGSVTSRFSATINPVASVTLDTSDISFTFTPTASGVFDSKPVTATVGTNSTGGYELYFSSEDNETDMKNALSSVTNVIASDFTGTVTSETMVANKWGYSLNNTDFSKIPALNAQATLKNIDHYPTTSEKTTTVNIGMKVDTNLPSGTYMKNVVFSVVAHETPPIPTMQDFDVSTLVNVGDSAILQDSRDGNLYTVKKLADGNIWMTENLRIAGKTITSEDSNLPSGETYTVPTSNASSFTESYNTNSAYLDSTYGGYYNFYTATAGWGTDSVESGNSPKDICPKGWRLPTGGDSSEFQTLYNSYNSSALMQGEPNFTLPGAVGNGSVQMQGLLGYFWSSTVGNANGAYALALINSDFAQVNNISPDVIIAAGPKAGGMSVRCVAGATGSTGNTGDTGDTGDGTTSGITMQTFDMSTMIPNTGDSMTLRDVRDDNMYTVKRLADGKVWMTENLRLINKTISSADSNLPSGETWTIPASSTSGFSSYNTNNAYLDSTYGGYYTFYAATAGWGTDSVTSGDSPKDICPKGWRLPTDDSTGEFQTLYFRYFWNKGSWESMKSDFNLTLSGDVHNGSVGGQGEYGSLWSSTVSDADVAYSLYVNSEYVTPASSHNKYYGNSVRCIAKAAEATGGRTISDITYMQDMTSKIAENTPINTVATLTDIRDNNTYTVRKLKDGKIWMTQNLRIAGKTITSADSNVSSDFTIPASSVSGFNAEDANNAYVDSTYGGYYTFYTATAGTGGSNLTSGDAPSSICPKGWRLPIGDRSGEFQTLYYTYHTGDLMQGDPNFTLSGDMYYGSVHNQGSSGSFWSSTVSSYRNAYYLGIPSVSTASNGHKASGFSVRCVAQ